MVSENVSRVELSHQTRDLECFADRYNIPWNLPTNFHSDLIATILQMYLLSLCALLSQQSITFRSVWCRRALIPKKIFTGFAKFQGIVSVNDFRLPILAPRTFASSFVFPEKFLFCTDTPGSIEWLGPAARLHIDDCFEIRNCH